MILLTSLISFSANAAEYTFTSRLDQFTVDVTGSAATVNGESVSAEPFIFVKPLFDTQFEDECEGKMGRADLSITRKRGESEEKRLIYYDKKIVSDGKNCGELTGLGIYRFPLHKNWFEGKKSVTIGLGDSFSIWKDKKLIVEFEKQNGVWKNKDKKFFTNWEFFENFVQATKDFPIDFRLHPSAAKEFTNFELRQGSRTFSFVKVGESTWAVQFPGSPWLAASGQFGLFEEMSQKIWISPYEKTLQIISDTKATPDARIKAVRELSGRWGPDLNYVLREVILSGDDNVEVKKDIASLMRSRPTADNFKTLVDSLKTSSDQEFLGHITKVLRVRNPKGPVIVATDSDEDVQKKIKEWTAWRKTLN